MTKDPVCGMLIDEHKAVAKAEHQGVTYYFCSSGCHHKFVADPGKYVKSASAPHGGRDGHVPEK